MGDENRKYVEIDNEDYKVANKMWKSSIYIYVADKRPYHVHLNAYIKHEWLLIGSGMFTHDKIDTF